MRVSKNAIIERWQPLLEQKAGIKDSYKVSWLSEYCHNHSISDSYNNGALNESFAYGSSANLGNVTGIGPTRTPSSPAGIGGFHQNQTGSPDKWPSLLPMSIQIATRTIGFDIVSVIPMSGPTGMLPYLDYVYSGGKLGTSESPLIIEIDSPNINSIKFVPGQKYWALSNNSDGTNYAANTKACEMLFVGYSKINGYPIFRIGSKFNMSGSGAGKTVDSTIALAQVFDTTGVIVADSSNTPVTATGISNMISVTARPQLVRASENNIPNFVGSGTYDEDTWQGSFANGQLPVAPMSRGTGESTYYRTMGVQAYTKTVEAETYQVAATVTQEQIQDMNKQWGYDVVAMVENALVNEISQGINKHILSRAFALGWSNNVSFYKTEGKTLNFTLDNTKLSNTTSPGFINKIGYTETLPVNKYANFGNFENMSTLQRRIYSKILTAGGIIAQRSKRGPGNFVVTNLQLAVALQDSSQYSFAPISNTINQNNGSLFPVGTAVGLTIYVDPNMNYSDTRILVGRKGADDEPGLKFMPYLMAESAQTIAENTMAPKIAIKSRYALVEAGHYPETMYYTIYVDLGDQDIV